MSIIKLVKYGQNLAGRALGMTTYPIIVSNYEAPYELDFQEVNSIGSSFADEVVAKLAALNGGTIKIWNSSRVIDKCLRDVSTDKKFTLIYDPSREDTSS